MEYHRDQHGKDPAAQWQGKVNHAQGRFFESRLLAGFAAAKRAGYANISKSHEPMKPIKDLGGGRFVAVYEKKSDVDFSGELAGGVMAVFEAKFTSTDRITQDRVTADQAKKLDEHRSFGAQCWVICGFSSGGIYKIPWAIWKDMKLFFGHKYVTENDLKPWTVTNGEGGVPVLISGR